MHFTSSRLRHPGHGGLDLRLSLPARAGEGGFVVAVLELANDGGQPRRIHGQRRLDGGDLWVKFTRAEDGESVILGRHGSSPGTSTCELPAGARLRWGLDLSRTEAGATLRRTGRYRVRAVYDAGTGPVESNHHTLTVVPSWLHRPAEAAPVLEPPPGAGTGRLVPAGASLPGTGDARDPGALLCQLGLVAACLHRAGGDPSARGRSRFLLDRAVARFGAAEVAVLITALFPHAGPVRRALCGAFERAVENVDLTEAAVARAIVRGDPFYPMTLCIPGSTPPHRLERH